MTALIVIAAVQTVLVAFLLWERHHASPDLDALIALVDRMAQRIQAPGAAVIEHDEAVRAHTDETYAPPAIEPDDDEAFWTSRDRLAEMLMAQETHGDGDR